MTVGLNFLSACIEHDSIDTLRSVTEEWFVGQDELNAYRAILGHIREYRIMPSFETLDELPIVDLPETTEPTSFYFNQLRDRKLYNDLRTPFNQLRQSLIDRNRETTVDIVNGMRRIVAEEPANRNRLVGGAEGARAVLEDYEYAHNFPGIRGVTTGWYTLDLQTYGYQNGDLIIWVARPEMGKTYLLVRQFYSAWLAGHRVLFLSMEMPDISIYRRVAAFELGINPTYIRNGELSTHQYDRLQDLHTRLDNDDRMHVHSGNFDRTTDTLADLINEIDPAIVYVDGMYLLRPITAGRGAGRYERVAFVTDELKHMTLQFNKPIVCTTQFSRQSGTGGAQGSLENIGYTDAISTHSSLVFSIQNEGSEQVKRINTLKGREGEEVDFCINYTFSPFDMDERPVEVSIQDQMINEPEDEDPNDY